MSEKSFIYQKILSAWSIFKHLSHFIKYVAFLNQTRVNLFAAKGKHFFGCSRENQGNIRKTHNEISFDTL